MMSFSVTFEPPRLPLDDQTIRARIVVRPNTRLQGEFDDVQAVADRVGRLFGALFALEYLPVAGTITVRITNGAATFAGKLTVFREEDRPRVAQTFDRVERLAFQIAQEYGVNVIEVAPEFHYVCRP